MREQFNQPLYNRSWQWEPIVIERNRDPGAVCRAVSLVMPSNVRRTKTARPPHRESSRSFAIHSRSAKCSRSQQLFDENELPDALRGRIGILTKRIILLQGLHVVVIKRTLDLSEVCSNLTGREHASYLGNKSGQLLGEFGTCRCRLGERHQLFADEVIESCREPVSCLDGSGRLALFDPDILRSAFTHHWPSSCRRLRIAWMPTIHSISTSAAAPKRCGPRWQRPFFDRPRRPASCPG